MLPLFHALITLPPSALIVTLIDFLCCVGIATVHVTTVRDKIITYAVFATLLFRCHALFIFARYFSRYFISATLVSLR